MEVPVRSVVAAIEDLGVRYELIEIDPELADTEVFCEHYGYPLDRTCNTIIVASKKEPKSYVACVVLATTRLDVNRTVRRLMGVPKASFATPAEMEALTGMQVGGVTPFALPADVPLWVDERIFALDWIILGAGGRSAKIQTSPDAFSKLGAELVRDLALTP